MKGLIFDGDGGEVDVASAWDLSAERPASGDG
jgi:hypothetical protein